MTIKNNGRPMPVNISDRILRNVAFFFSLILYFTLLPIVLSYSLGYHIDFHNLKIYKMGILSLKSAPSGAYIYINGKLRQEITPARIEELKPGTYSVEVKRDGFYPWQNDLTINPNMVTRAENIILFPLLQNMEKISDYETVNFIVSDNKNYIYHMTKSGLYRSNMDGTNLKKLSFYTDWPEKVLEKKFSPDGRKILYFNDNNIWVIYLVGRDLVKDGELAYVEEVLKTPGSIKNAFWHSGSNHIIFIVNKDIDVIELGAGGEKNIVTLHKCRKAAEGFYYDDSSDSLYFNDNYEGKEHLYRLDLREKLFEKLMQRVKKELDIIYEKR